MLRLSKAWRICCFYSQRIKKRLCILCISKPQRTQPSVSKSVGIKWSLIPASRLFQLVMKRLFKFLLLLSFICNPDQLPLPYIFSKVFTGFRVILRKVLPETPLMTLQTSSNIKNYSSKANLNKRP